MYSDTSSPGVTDPNSPSPSVVTVETVSTVTSSPGPTGPGPPPSSDLPSSPIPSHIEFIHHNFVHAGEHINALFEETGHVDLFPDDDYLDDNYGFSDYHVTPDASPSMDASSTDSTSSGNCITSSNLEPLNDYDIQQLSILHDPVPYSAQASSPLDHNALYEMDHLLYRAEPHITRLHIYQLKGLPELNSTSKQHAHMDGGSMVTTCHDLRYVYSPKPIRKGSVCLRVADNRPHYPTHTGYLAVPCPHLPHGYALIQTYLTPTLPVIIVSPDAISKQYQCEGYSAISYLNGQNCAVTLTHCLRHSQNITVPCQLHRGLLYTEPIPLVSDDPDLADRIQNPTLDVLSTTPCASCTSPDTPSPVHDINKPTPPVTCNACTADSPGTSPSTVCSPCKNTCPFPPPTKHAPPNNDVTLPDLHDKIDMFRRLGYQSDVSLPTLSRKVHGVPDFTQVDDTLLSKSIPSPSLLDPEEYQVSNLTRDKLRILWHHRLGHLNSRRCSEMHKFARGIPRLPIASCLDTCPICQNAKLHKSSHPKRSSRRATQCLQGISIDFGFIVQASSTDPDRVERLQGINGETCYCLIVDHHGGNLWGRCFRSKAPPIDYLNHWLSLHSDPTIPDKYVRFDRGGELGKCEAIADLFEQHGWRIEPTAPDCSHSNGPGERPHRTIGDGIRSMLLGSALPAKFWPYAFHHFIRLYNVTPHGTNDASPYTMRTGRIPDLGFLRTFGCRIRCLPPRPHRPDALNNDVRTGIFLGYSNTSKNILYYDFESNTVKDSQHVAYDEAHCGFTDAISPHSRILNTADPSADVFTSFLTMKLPTSMSLGPLSFNLKPLTYHFKLMALLNILLDSNLIPVVLCTALTSLISSVDFLAILFALLDICILVPILPRLMMILLLPFKTFIMF